MPIDALILAYLSLIRLEIKQVDRCMPVTRFFERKARQHQALTRIFERKARQRPGVDALF